MCGWGGVHEYISKQTHVFHLIWLHLCQWLNDIHPHDLLGVMGQFNTQEEYNLQELFPKDVRKG